MDDRRTGDQGSERERAARMGSIVTEYETALLRYATRLVNNRTTAQDVVQNAFIKLFTRWDEEIVASPRLKGWLFRVTHNEAVDHVRRESRLQLLHSKHAEEQEHAPAHNPHGPLDDQERRALVLAELRKLHPREQQVVLLRLEQGLSYREIAEIMGRTEGNVGNILHHAVKKLSRKLAGVAA